MRPVTCSNPVPQGIGLCLGQLAVEAADAQPCKEVGGGQHEFEARLVVGEVNEGHAVEAGCRARGLDGVRHPGVAALAQLERKGSPAELVSEDGWWRYQSVFPTGAAGRRGGPPRADRTDGPGASRPAFQLHVERGDVTGRAGLTVVSDCPGIVTARVIFGPSRSTRQMTAGWPSPSPQKVHILPLKRATQRATACNQNGLPPALSPFRPWSQVRR